MRYVLSWIILAALIFPTAAFATKGPCTADRLNFGKGVKASAEDIRTCLQGHKDELSEPCKARLGDQLPTDASSTPRDCRLHRPRLHIEQRAHRLPHTALRTDVGGFGLVPQSAVPDLGPEQYMLGDENTPPHPLVGLYGAAGATRKAEIPAPPEQPSPAAAEDSSAETNHATVPSSPPADEGGNSRPAAESTKATEEPSAAANKAEDSAQPSPEQNGGKSQAAESKKPLQRHSPGPIQGSTLSAYDKKVWTTLARHRLKGISGGSAQVTFGVGPSGELVYARLSRSSGNSNVDQMAIATVRKSAPFPQPTAAHGSVQSFTIRIGSR